MAIEIAGLKTPFPPRIFPPLKIQAGTYFGFYGDPEIDNGSLWKMQAAYSRDSSFYIAN